MSGCGWRVTPPDLPGTSKHAWSSAEIDSKAAAGAPGDHWWKDVGGSSLDSLIEEGLKNSASLEVMAGRLEVAKADAQILGAPSQPTVSASAAQRSGIRQEFETGGERASVMRYAGMAQFGWELDFWGRVHQLRQGAKQSVEMAQADYEFARLLLAAEIARVETARRRYAAEEKVILRSLDANNEIVERLEERREAGIDDDSAVDRQKAVGDAMRRDVEEMRRLQRLSELSLDRLLGREPGTGNWSKSTPSLGPPPSTPSVLPSELLTRRPDLRSAASKVASTWHISQAATLDLLPKVSLGGLLGGRTMTITPRIDQWVASVGPILEIPIWDPERKAKSVRAGARADLAASEFREAVLNAFEEVEAAYTNLAAQGRIYSSAKSSADSLEAVFSRTRERFGEGLISQLEVLEDERRTLEASREAIRAREAHLAAWIALAKALGATPAL